MSDENKAWDEWWPDGEEFPSGVDPAFDLNDNLRVAFGAAWKAATERERSKTAERLRLFADNLSSVDDCIQLRELASAIKGGQ